MEFNPAILNHFVNPDINELLIQIGYSEEAHLYTQVFDWLETQDLHIHDCWISPIKQWNVSVIEMSTGKRLWPERIIPKEQYYPEKRIAWNIALVAAIEIIKSKKPI